MRRGRRSKCSREMARKGMRTGPVPLRCSQQHGHTTPLTRFHEVSLSSRGHYWPGTEIFRRSLQPVPVFTSTVHLVWQYHCHLHPQGCPHVNTGTFPTCIISVAGWSVYLAILILVSRWQSRYFHDHFLYTSNHETTQKKIPILFYLFVILKLTSSYSFL